MTSAAQSPKSWVAQQATHGGWLDGPYYIWWSVYAVGRNDDKTLIWPLWCLFSTITRAYFLVNLEGTRFLLKVLKSFWNLTGGSPPVFPSRLSTFKAIGIFFQLHTVVKLRNIRGKFINSKLDYSMCKYGLPVHLWVAFGDRATVFGQHCMSG